jgi:hypothetical protein
MAIKGIQVDRRVAIAMDALSSGQKTALKRLLESKEQFLAYAKKPGATKEISASKPLYAMRAGSGMRIVFETHNDSIVVRDLMQKATMDRYLKRKRKTAAAKKANAAVKQAGIKIPKV